PGELCFDQGGLRQSGRRTRFQLDAAAVNLLSPTAMPSLENKPTDLFAVRSILFLPASNPRAIAKARESAADLVVLDLEDAVKPADKDLAREAAVEAAATPWRMPLAIRVNGVGTQWHAGDLVAVSGSEADFVVVPRA